MEVPANTFTGQADGHAPAQEPVIERPEATADSGDDEDAVAAGDDVEGTAAENQRRVQEARNSEVAQKMGGNATVQDAKTAHRRLMRDLRSLQQTLASPAGEEMGISAHPIEGDLFHWRAIIAGPGDSPWEGGLFKLDLKFNDRYPLEPPTVRFLTPDVFHPNVYVDGNICLDTLRSTWSPTLDVENLLLSITSLLSDPNPRSAANGEAARLLLENRPMYEERVRKVAEASLEQEFSDMDDDEDDEEA